MVSNPVSNAKALPAHAKSEVIVAVADLPFDPNKLSASVVKNFYINEAEKPGDGKDNDGNGYIDDYRGPWTSTAALNYIYGQAGSTQSHGIGMVTNVSKQIDAVASLTGENVATSIMSLPPYYASIQQAIAYGARVISYSFQANSQIQAHQLSEWMRQYDVIFVGQNIESTDTWDTGEFASSGDYDNYVEVGMISAKVVKGTGQGTDLLEYAGDNATSESPAISTVAGKIAAIWGLNPAWTAKDVMKIIGMSTSMDHPLIAANNLTSDMGGQIDLEKAVKIAIQVRENGFDGVTTTPMTPVVTTPVVTTPPVSQTPATKVVKMEFSGNYNLVSDKTRYDEVHIKSLAASNLTNDASYAKTLVYDSFLGPDHYGLEHRVTTLHRGDVLDLTAIVKNEAINYNGKASDYFRLDYVIPRSGDPFTYIYFDRDGKGAAHKADLKMKVTGDLGSIDKAIADGRIVLVDTPATVTPTPTPTPTVPPLVQKPLPVDNGGSDIDVNKGPLNLQLFEAYDHLRWVASKGDPLPTAGTVAHHISSEYPTLSGGNAVDIFVFHEDMPADSWDFRSSSVQTRDKLDISALVTMQPGDTLADIIKVRGYDYSGNLRTGIWLDRDGSGTEHDFDEFLYLYGVKIDSVEDMQKFGMIITDTLL